MIENLGTGVKHMFYDPLSALVKGKGTTKVLSKFAEGTSSLITSTIKNIWITVKKILGTVMKILASLTFQEGYLHER